MPDLPRRLAPDDPALPQVLALIRAAFAYMDGVIDPPSSLHRLTLADLAVSEVWATGTPPVACAVFTPRPGALCVGKLAVADSHRGQGLARALLDAATARAREHGLPVLELQTRVELTQNHTAFARLGFVEVERTSHKWFDRPTSVTLRRPVS